MADNKRISQLDLHTTVGGTENVLIESGTTAKRLSVTDLLGDTLWSIRSKGTAAAKMLYTTALNTWAEADITAFARTLLDDATAAAARTTLGLDTIGQAEAEAGTATTERAWTAERVKQAIAALETAALNVPTIQVFTSSGTYTPPAGLRAVKVTVVGGGGGGGQAGTPANSSSGGGGGGTSIEYLLVGDLGATETVTVGAAGTGGASSGGTGGTSSFGALLSATGGSGGLSGGAGGAGGLGSGGDLNIAGNAGESSSVEGADAQPQNGGSGGSSLMGGGGNAGNAGGAYGGGGGGGIAPSNNGGAGAAGVVIVEEFY